MSNVSMIDGHIDEMSEKNIIKALQICTSQHLGCEDGCPYREVGVRECEWALQTDSLKLIKHQQAEIERMSQPVFIMETTEMTDEEIKRLRNKPAMLTIKPSDDTIRNEAITEFAERLKEKADRGFFLEHSYVDVEDIDNTLKEMVGDAE